MRANFLSRAGIAGSTGCLLLSPVLDAARFLRHILKEGARARLGITLTPTIEMYRRRRKIALDIGSTIAGDTVSAGDRQNSCR